VSLPFYESTSESKMSKSSKDINIKFYRVF
jgi:hypothetical protein